MVSNIRRLSAQGERDSPMKLVHQLIEERARENPDKLFLRFEDRTVTFDGLNKGTNRVANGLLGLGCGPKTGSSVMMQNSPEWLHVYFATQKIGAYAGYPCPERRAPLTYLGRGFGCSLFRFSIASSSSGLALKTSSHCARAWSKRPCSA